MSNQTLVRGLLFQEILWDTKRPNNRPKLSNILVLEMKNSANPNVFTHFFSEVLRALEFGTKVPENFCYKKRFTWCLWVSLAIMWKQLDESSVSWRNFLRSAWVGPSGFKVQKFLARFKLANSLSKWCSECRDVIFKFTDLWNQLCKALPRPRATIWTSNFKAFLWEVLNENPKDPSTNE